MTDLSPAAQAVLDAAFPVYDEENLYTVSSEQHAGMIAAAALVAAADQADPEKHIEDIDYVHQMYTDGCYDTIATFLAIAAELEAKP